METSEVNQLLEGQTTFAQEKDGLEIYYVLPREERVNIDRGFRVFCIGQPADRATRCVLLLGETGAGKTTFIDAAINYLFGVRFEHPFRLRVKKETEDNRMETVSQTDLITAYTIYYKEGMKHKYNYVLIDTPGLADTRGAQQQHDTRSRLEAFLTSDFGVDDLNCVGLVAKANTNRDLDSQKALLGEIMSLVGGTVPEITHIFATFALDEPIVDNVMRNAGISFESMFEFDNGILFSPTVPNTSSHRRHVIMPFRWDNMNLQYETFFNALVNASSVNLEILRERKLFDRCKKDLKAHIGKLATLKAAMEEKKTIYTRYELQKANNEGWMQEETVEERFTENLVDDAHALNCNICHQTCGVFIHDNSSIWNRFKRGIFNISNGIVAGVSVAMAGVSNMVLVVTGSAAVASEGAGVVVGSLLFGSGVAVGALIIGGATYAVYSITQNESGVVGGKDSECGKNGCTHTKEEHNKEKYIVVKRIQVHKRIDENMKRLYCEAISKLKEVNDEITNGQQEILSCNRSTSYSTVKLLSHAKRIQELNSEDSDYIEDVSSELINEIRRGEPDIIPHAVKYVDIITEAMRTLASHTTEEVLGKHGFVKEMLLRGN